MSWPYLHIMAFYDCIQCIGSFETGTFRLKLVTSKQCIVGLENAFGPVVTLLIVRPSILFHHGDEVVLAYVQRTDCATLPSFYNDLVEEELPVNLVTFNLGQHLFDGFRHIKSVGSLLPLVPAGF